MSKLLPDAVRELVRICARLVSGNEACVVLEHVVEMFWVGRERFAPIRIPAHLAKRQWFDGVAVGGVEIHVLFVAVGLEEVVARPTIGKRRQLALIEFKLDFFSGAKDCKFVIELREQRK